VKQVRAGLRLLLRAAGWSLAAVVTGAVVVVGVGIFAGYRPVVIQTGSMGETAPPGSVVIAAPKAGDEIRTGDILVMHRPGRPLVTHRVAELEITAERSFAVTKGDANPDLDPDVYPIGDRELVGRWVVPRLGGAITLFGNPATAVAVLALVVGGVALSLLRWIWRPAPAPQPATATARPVQRERRAPRAAAATGALALFLTGGVAWALFTATTSVAGNTFGSDDCFDARVASVETGTVVSSASGDQSVAISAVDTSRSFLLYSVSSASASPGDTVVRGRLLDATTVQFTRATTTPSPPAVNISWSVVQYDCGVTVQRGVTTGTGTAIVDVPITAVDPATSFATVGLAPQLGAASFTTIAPELTSATNLRLHGGAALSASDSLAWQVVTFTDAADAHVQHQTETFTSTATATLASPVPQGSTFVLAAGVMDTAASAGIGDRLVEAHLSSPTTVELQRDVSNATDLKVYLQTVTLHDGSAVQHGVVDFLAGQPTKTVTIEPVDTNRASAMTTATNPGAVAGGRTTQTTPAVAGEASARVDVADAVTVTLTRDATSSPASFGWQVIEWGGPVWWDVDYDFRQRIDVTAGAVGTPDEYTVAVALDHAALVTAGLALADGSDVRVVRWDGSSWTELHRVLDDGASWNDPAATFLFRTTEPVAAQTTSTYWLYYGNTMPDPVLDDPEQVFLLTEDFESGTLGDFEDRTAGTGWYSALPWTRRRVVTVQSSQVAGPLTDVPVLVQVSAPDLATTAQLDGDDFRFTAGDGITPLPHEIEAWDVATSTLTAWVKVPSLSNSVNTPLYLYYGAADAPDQQDPYGVWTNEFEAVWLLARDPAGAAPQLFDSGPARHEGLSSGSITSGDLLANGDGLDLDGSNDRLDAGSFTVASAQLTLSGWVRLDSFSDADPRLVAKASGPLARSFELLVDDQAPASGQVRARLTLGGTTYEAAGGTVTIGVLHHLAATWDGTTLAVHLDGTLVGQTAASGALASNTMPVTLGDLTAGTASLDGLLDNVTIATVARSQEWLATEYAMRSAPITFVTVGAAETGTWLGQGTWTYRKPVVVDASAVTGSLTDYPLLVQVTDLTIGAASQADGDDLVFTAGDGTTRLDHEIEAWNVATGELTAWVRVPSLTDAADTTLYLYYGNASAADQQDPAGTFGDDASLVLHGTGPG
jgi:signal peptidase I